MTPLEIAAMAAWDRRGLNSNPPLPWDELPHLFREEKIEDQRSAFRAFASALPIEGMSGHCKSIILMECSHD